MWSICPQFSTDNASVIISDNSTANVNSFYTLRNWTKTLIEILIFENFYSTWKIHKIVRDINTLYILALKKPNQVQEKKNSIFQIGKMKSDKNSISRSKIKLLTIMATLILIERSFMISGIQSVPEQYLPMKSQKYRSNIRRCQLTFGMVSLLSFLSSMTCFILFKAKAFADYAEVSTFFVGTFFLLAFYASFAWHSSEVTGILADLKSIVEQSESKQNE